MDTTRARARTSARLGVSADSRGTCVTSINRSGGSLQKMYSIALARLRALLAVPRPVRARHTDTGNRTSAQRVLRCCQLRLETLPIEICRWPG